MVCSECLHISSGHCVGLNIWKHGFFFGNDGRDEADEESYVGKKRATVQIVWMNGSKPDKEIAGSRERSAVTVLAWVLSEQTVMEA